MKTESEIFKIYESEIRAWAYYKTRGIETVYTACFHRAWALADVLEIPGNEVTQQFRMAELVHLARENDESS